MASAPSSCWGLSSAQPPPPLRLPPPYVHSGRRHLCNPGPVPRGGGAAASAPHRPHSPAAGPPARGGKPAPHRGDRPRRRDEARRSPRGGGGGGGMAAGPPPGLPWGSPPPGPSPPWNREGRPPERGRGRGKGEGVVGRSRTARGPCGSPGWMAAGLLQGRLWARRPSAPCACKGKREGRNKSLRLSPPCRLRARQVFEHVLLHSRNCFPAKPKLGRFWRGAGQEAKGREGLERGRGPVVRGEGWGRGWGRGHGLCPQQSVWALVLACATRH